jgi:hypothetical protein
MLAEGTRRTGAPSTSSRTRHDAVAGYPPNAVGGPGLRSVSAPTAPASSAGATATGATATATGATATATGATAATTGALTASGPGRTGVRGATNRAGVTG